MGTRHIHMKCCLKGTTSGSYRREPAFVLLRTGETGTVHGVTSPGSPPLTYLVPLDGRVGPTWVTDQAIKLARAHGGTVLGLSTLQGSAAQDDLHSFQERCRIAGIAGTGLHLPGPRFQGIMEASQRADLVMVAWTAESARILDFSTFGALVRHATCPVWIAPPSGRVPTELTVAFHGQRKAFHAIAQAAKLAHTWQLPVDTLVVAEGPDINDHDTLIARQELRARNVIERHSRYERGVTGEILAAVTSPDHLLIMGGAGDGPFFGLTLSRIVRQVLRLPRGPVLICP